jgi:GT2 family glycosyltransferase/glycosyltransferase involved in cell wall biosynthesis
MNDFFKRIKCGVLNDHYDLLGGGTVHSFKFIEYLKRYYDVEVNVPGNPKSKEWMQTFLHLDTEGLTFLPYAKGCGNKYDYLFLNISHWRAEETNALKKYMLVFFPQFYFPLYDYRFLANSQYTKKNIISKWQRPEELIDVVYPPIMTSQFTPLQKTKSIIHVSRITPPVPEADKGHRQMITAFKEMVDSGVKDWTFHIVGQIQDQSYYEELYRMATGYPIVFHTGVSFQELKELYGQSSIYWHITGISLPNEIGAQEHFGMTTVESMASGCVPVVLNTGGQPEIIYDSINGYLINNTEELKNRTLYLINNPQILEQKSKAAIERSKEFDEDIMRKKFYSIVTKTDKVSIIMVCWNNSQFTKDCVNRLYEVTPEGFELILIDNASKDDTWNVIQELQGKYPNIKAIHNEKNMGFATGNNQGLKIATKEYICHLNNDTIPQWGWLERMVDVLENKPEVGIVGARLYFNKDENGIWKIQHAGVTFKSGQLEHIGRFQHHEKVPRRGIEEVESVTGACMLIRKELAGFDEEYIRGYYEDIDLCLSIREKGFKVVINHEAKLIHFEGMSQILLKKEDENKFNKVTEENKKRFDAKWHISRINSLPKIDMTPDLTGINHEEKIEIGGGERPLHEDYSQVDLKRLSHIRYNNDARILPFPNNTLTDICSSYMITCLSKSEAEVALKEWFRCLKPGGRLELYVPDLNKVFRNIISTREEELLKEVYGQSDAELDMFKWGYDFQSIDVMLSRVNFVRVQLIKPTPMHPNSLGVEAFKPL